MINVLIVQIRHSKILSLNFSHEKNAKKATQDKRIIRKLDGNTAVDLRNIKQTGRNKINFRAVLSNVTNKKGFFAVVEIIPNPSTTRNDNI